ncbi:AI-2E family transporter [Sporolactobacillus sp. THM7-7]|nr:AI-2E family transporter [Sporolactobacillus sp. THM7-7]
MPQSKYFRAALWILTIFAIMWVGSKLTFVLEPIGVLITSLAAPLIISGLLYYLLRPLVRGLMKLKIPKVLAILIIYLVAIGLLTLLVVWIGPLLYAQLLSLIASMPGLVRELGSQLNDLQHSEWLSKVDLNDISYNDITTRFSDNLSSFATTVGNNILSIIQSVTGMVLIIVMVPFILFYFLKDGHKMAKAALRFIPEEHRPKAQEILTDMDRALSGYIQGQMIVLLFDFIFIYIWYAIIGLNYSLVLASIILFTNLIPFIGSFLATIPAVIVGYIQEPIMAVYVIAGVLVVQQIEGNIISPMVMGRKLDVHPVTIICLLLVAGNLAGIIGMLLAIPVYAVCKVVITRVYQLIQLRRQ